MQPYWLVNRLIRCVFYDYPSSHLNKAFIFLHTCIQKLHDFVFFIEIRGVVSIPVEKQFVHLGLTVITFHNSETCYCRRATG